MISDAHVVLAAVPPFRWHDWYRLEDSFARFARAVSSCVAAGADALLIPGDVTHGGDRAALEAVVAVLEDSGLPSWIAGGNHDTLAGPGLLEAALDAAPSGRVRGVRPAGERFAGVLVAGGHARAVDAGGYRTDEPSIDAEIEPIIWMSHFPTLPMAERLRARGLAHAGDAQNRQAIASSLEAHGAPSLIVAGHLHVRDAVASRAMLQVSSAALVEPPFEVSLVDVELSATEGRVRVACHAVDASAKEVRLPVVAPQVSAWGFSVGAGWEPVVQSA